jgi:hypothetical protein
MQFVETELNVQILLIQMKQDMSNVMMEMIEMEMDVIHNVKSVLHMSGSPLMQAHILWVINLLNPQHVPIKRLP